MNTQYTIIEREVTGDIMVSENSQFNHMNAENVIVAENITARLFGTIRSRLVVHKGARVYLHGSIGGEVENNGGEFYRY